jgi:hypothetical protein
MTIAVNGHGTLISRALAATPTVYVEIAELGDITLPGITKNEFDASVQNRTSDDWLVSSLIRREATTFPINFIGSNSTHDHLTGLYKAAIDTTLDGYKFTLTSGGSIYLTYIHSGYVKSVSNMKAPVDGKLTADVTLRFTGPYLINGVVIGL